MRKPPARMTFKVQLLVKRSSAMCTDNEKIERLTCMQRWQQATHPAVDMAQCCTSELQGAHLRLRRVILLGAVSYHRHSSCGAC